MAGLLHAGEAAALALALELKADWFLTDDASARVLAGSLGVVLWSAGQGRLDRQTASRKLEALFQSSLWVSARVQQEARRALDRIFGGSNSPG